MLRKINKFSFYSNKKIEYINIQNVPDANILKPYTMSKGTEYSSFRKAVRQPWTPPPPLETQIEHQRVDFVAKRSGEFFEGNYHPTPFTPGATPLLRSGTTRVHARNLPHGDDLFVIGIRYDAGDTQCSITGSVEVLGGDYNNPREDPRRAAVREAQEEVGLTCNIEDLGAEFIQDADKKVWHTFAVHISQMRQLKPPDRLTLPSKQSFPNRRRPPSGHKLQLYIYGTRDELLEVLSRVYIRTSEENDISGVVLLKADTIPYAFPRF